MIHDPFWNKNRVNNCILLGYTPHLARGIVGTMIREPAGDIDRARVRKGALEVHLTGANWVPVDFDLDHIWFT